MRKEISLFILSNTGSSVKHLTLSRGIFRIISLCCILCLVFFTYVIYDYFNLKRSLLGEKELKSSITSQSDEILSQRKQIQKFAGEINELKSKLVTLNNFEKKIKIIANIENTADHESLFGVGGANPEDLDSQVPLREKHNSLMREMHEQAKQLNLAAIGQEKRFGSLLEYLKGQRNLLSSTPAIRPTKGWLTSRFGYRLSPFTGLREFHKGLDIATRKGTPIIATADGVVTFAGKKGLLGLVVVIDHGHGIVTRYGHCLKMLKKRGDAVKRGDTIALVGNSGRSTGPHVHYEVMLNGIPVNPAKYILN